MRTPSSTQPGFTLLEVMLAAAIGSIVALVAIGLLSTLNRADARLSDRYREITQLERAHTIMSRAFSSVLVAERTNVRVNRARTTQPGTEATTNTDDAQRNQPNGRIGSSARNVAAPEQSPGPSATTGASNPTERAKLDQPARIALYTDAGLAGLGMARPAAARLTVGEAQRFELVLAATPVPQRVAARTRARIAESLQTSMFEQESPDSPMPDSTGQAVRGVFELRPTAAPGRPMFAPDGTVRSWTLWWRPLPRMMKSAEGDVRPVGVAPGDPVEVATDLAYCRWQVFDDRKRKSDYAAVYFTDLPAYIEMEVQTTSGIWANWMFEVDWATGSESAGRDDEESEGEPQGDLLGGRAVQEAPQTGTGGAK